MGNASVRIKTTTGDYRFVTGPGGQVTNLQHSDAAWGGYERASFTLTVGHNEIPDFTENCLVWIYDDRNAGILWNGKTAQPTPTRTDDGETWEVVAEGGWAQASKHSEKLLFIDQTTDFWTTEDRLPQHANGQAENSGQFPEGSSREGERCLRLGFPTGSKMVPGDQVGLKYAGFAGSAMLPGALLGGYMAGQGYDYPVGTGNSAGRIQIYGDVTAGVPEQLLDAPLSTTEDDVARYADPTSAGAPASDEWTFGSRFLGFTYYWDGSALTISVDTLWVSLRPPIIICQLLAADRTERDMSNLPGTVGMPDNYAGIGTVDPEAWLFVHDVVADLVGRMMWRYVDHTRFTIAEGTYQITQLVYADGASAASVFDYFVNLEPDMTPRLLDMDEDGLFGGGYEYWPTTVRYEISERDGYSKPGGEVSLCNRAFVTYTDAKGVRQTIKVGIEVLALGVGSPVNIDGTDNDSFVGEIVDTAQAISLPDGLADEATAVQVATGLLARANEGTNSGTAAVTGWIWDHATGNMVEFQELRGRELVRVRETSEVHRLTRVSVDHETATAVLTLGTPKPTAEQLLARLTGRGRTLAKATR